MKAILLTVMLLTQSVAYAGGGGAGNDWPRFICADNLFIEVLQHHWYVFWRDGVRTNEIYESKTMNRDSGDLFIDSEITGDYIYNQDQLILNINQNTVTLVCDRIPGTGVL